MVYKATFNLPNGKCLFGSAIPVSGLTPNQNISPTATNLVDKKLAYHYIFYNGIPYGYMYDSDNSSNTQQAGHDIGLGINIASSQTIAIIKY